MTDRWILGLALLLASLTLSLTQASPQDYSPQDELSYEYPDRYPVPPETVELADLLAAKDSAWGIRQLLNGLRQSRRQKKTPICSIGGGLSNTCNNIDALEAAKLHSFVKGFGSPGRRRRRNT